MSLADFIYHLEDSMGHRYYIIHRNMNSTLGVPKHPSAMSSPQDHLVPPSQEFEIQLLDDSGRSTKTFQFSSHDISQELSISDVPNEVVLALRALRKGVGIVVDEIGQEVSPF